MDNAALIVAEVVSAALCFVLLRFMINREVSFELRQLSIIPGISKSIARRRVIMKDLVHGVVCARE